MSPPKIINHKRGPERIIQDDIINYLRAREWLVLETHGNMYQSGFPDLYATHKKYGPRWIEVKNAASYSFTAAQIETFPALSANGTSIWILVAATEEEYKKLWLPPNWNIYLLLLNHKACLHEHITTVEQARIRSQTSSVAGTEVTKIEEARIRTTIIETAKG